jgi:hypothetical protein
MKSLVFMMLLTMAAISAGVVYLSINRDPMDGVPHVDVTLDAPPQEEVKTEAPEATTAAATADPSANVTAGSETDATFQLPAEGDDGEPLTTTAFPIPEADPAAATTDPAAGDATQADGGEPAAVDQ